MKIKNSIILYSVLLVLLASCSGMHSVSEYNYYMAYDPTEMPIKPKFSVFHQNDSVTQITFQIKSSNLNYFRVDTLSKIVAKYSFRYKLYPDYQSKNVIDSGSFRFADTVPQLNLHAINRSILLKMRQGRNYVLEMKIYDDIRKIGSAVYVEIEKNGIQGNQYFLVLDDNHLVVNDLSLNEGESYGLVYQKPDVSKLSIKYYKHNFAPARSPFYVEEDPVMHLNPDSSYFVTKQGGLFNFKPQGEGLYYIQADTSLKDGMTLRVFNPDYPLQNTVDLLVEPLVYITSDDEFRAIKSGPNKKIGVDQFWIEVAGNPQRARELIANYYSRVQDANVLFVSYLEGWKSDRGMIYIIFGPPDVVSKNDYGETWIYGEARNINSISFKFQKVANPFSSNDFMLVRSPLYKNVWLNAVELWRR